MKLDIILEPPILTVIIHLWTFATTLSLVAIQEPCQCQLVEDLSCPTVTQDQEECPTSNFTLELLDNMELIQREFQRE